jgi:quercetin dioxygenase-like cupin family protein
VLEGSVILEVDGQPAQTFKAGQAFQELPNVVHNFKNASTTEPAKAVGIQYAARGQPLQVDAHWWGGRRSKELLQLNRQAPT